MIESKSRLDNITFNDTTSNIMSVIASDEVESITSNKSGNEDENWKKVLSLCHQINPIPFGLEFPSEAFSSLKPIDSGSYSFVCKGFDKRINKEVVFKIINVISSKTSRKLHGLPLDGKELLSDVVNEIIVSKCLSNLHITTVDKIGHEFVTHCFPRVVKTSLVQGSIPNYLLLMSTNDSMDKLEKIEVNREIPGIPREYLVITMKHCGEPLWKLISTNKVTANQLLSVCLQLTLALAVSECVYEFEHRDLHIANVLLKKTKKQNIDYTIETQSYRVPSYGFKAIIIDTTFSRIKIGENVFFTSLSSRLKPKLKEKDPDLQDWVYIKMTQEANDDWYKWNPATNLYWLRYFYRTVQTTPIINKNIKMKQTINQLLKSIVKYKTLKQFIKQIVYIR